MADPVRVDSLSRWERLGLCSFLALAVVFGLLTLWRAAYMNSRKGDQEIYFRSAYAIRTGANVYDVECSHGWHYTYPPLFAILLTPLAERPPQAPVELWTLPYGVSVGIWYAVSLAALALSVHSMASAVEHAAGVSVQPGGRRWWFLRLAPVLVCLPAVGHTLMRGQVNLVLLALIAGMIAGLLKNRPWRAGLWLGLAICIKIIPAFLLLYPLWRRDTRCLGGCTLGLFAGLVVIPVAALGPVQTAACYRDLYTKLILPGLGQNDDQSRAGELISMTATHSQSFQAAIHGILHWPERPATAARETRLTHWLAAGLLGVAVLWSSGWQARPAPADTLLTLGALTLLMALASPVCHMHYFVHAIPLIMGLLAVAGPGPRDLRANAAWSTLFGAFTLTLSLLQVPGLEVPRDLAVALYPSLLLLAVGMRLLYLRRQGHCYRLAAEVRAYPLAA